MTSVAAARTWTSRDGSGEIDWEMVGFAGEKVWLALPDDKLLLLAVDQLSPADREYFHAQRPRFVRAQPPDPPGGVPFFRYGPGRLLANLSNPAIDESSGIACSRRRPNVFWTHNDSGDAARLYAFDLHGRDLGSCLITGVEAFDWEDMASVQLDGKSWLLIGDTGNNGRHAAVQMIHVVEEPDVDPQRGVAVERVPVHQTLHYSYADGLYDCEALGVDPTTRTILLVTKEQRFAAYVYALPWPRELPPGPPRAQVVKRIATLDLPLVTGMDITPDGRHAVVLTYGDAFEFTRSPGEEWAQALARRPRRIDLPPRRQGEGVCYGPDGKTLYLTSEKKPTPLWEVRVEK